MAFNLGVCVPRLNLDAAVSILVVYSMQLARYLGVLAIPHAAFHLFQSAVCCERIIRRRSENKTRYLLVAKLLPMVTCTIGNMILDEKYHSFELIYIVYYACSLKIDEANGVKNWVDTTTSSLSADIVLKGFYGSPTMSPGLLTYTYLFTVAPYMYLMIHQTLYGKPAEPRDAAYGVLFAMNCIYMTYHFAVD